MTTQDRDPPGAPSADKERPQWELYERLIARLLVEQVDTDLCVTPNARIRGRISDAVRQIDVVIDSRHDTDNSRRIIVDAKKRRRKVDVKDVEEFEGLMKDVGATYGCLVSPAGHTKAAERRAQEKIGISIVPLEHVEHIDPSRWPRCLAKGCSAGRVFWDGFPEISTLLRPVSNAEAGELLVRWVYYVGKCDRCGRFHVYCATCYDLFSCSDTKGEHQCRCSMPWYWLASIEQDEAGEASAELRWVTARGPIIVDRRPFSMRQ